MEVDECDWVADFADVARGATGEGFGVGDRADGPFTTELGALWSATAGVAGGEAEAGCLVSPTGETRVAAACGLEVGVEYAIDDVDCALSGPSSAASGAGGGSGASSPGAVLAGILYASAGSGRKWGRLPCPHFGQSLYR